MDGILRYGILRMCVIIIMQATISKLRQALTAGLLGCKTKHASSQETFIIIAKFNTE